MVIYSSIAFFTNNEDVLCIFLSYLFGFVSSLFYSLVVFDIDFTFLTKN